MRKMMSKEVQFTTIQYATMEVVAGQPKAIIQPERIEIGKVTMEKAQKLIHEEVGINATVLKVTASSKVFEMKVEDFIKYATEKTDDSEEEESSDIED